MITDWSFTKKGQCDLDLSFRRNSPEKDLEDILCRVLDIKDLCGILQLLWDDIPLLPTRCLKQLETILLENHEEFWSKHKKEFLFEPDEGSLDDVTEGLRVLRNRQTVHKLLIKQYDQEIQNRTRFECELAYHTDLDGPRHARTLRHIEVMESTLINQCGIFPSEALSYLQSDLYL